MDKKSIIIPNRCFINQRFLSKFRKRKTCSGPYCNKKKCKKDSWQTKEKTMEIGFNKNCCTKNLIIEKMK